MIPESKLKSDCTPEIIKKMVELAEGFEYKDEHCIYFNKSIVRYTSRDLKSDISLFPLLIHRAVEGWNNKDNQSFYLYMGYRYISKNYPEYDIRYAFKNYQTQTLTPRECDWLHCLIEVLK